MAFFAGRNLDHAVFIDGIGINRGVFIADFFVIDFGPATLDQAACLTAGFGKVRPACLLYTSDAADE